MQELSIQKLARAAKLSPKTIRVYERAGLLSPPVRGRSGARCYTELQLEELLIIRQARRVGFALKEITVLLAPNPDGDIA